MEVLPAHRGCRGISPRQGLHHHGSGTMRRQHHAELLHPGPGKEVCNNTWKRSERRAATHSGHGRRLPGDTAVRHQAQHERFRDGRHGDMALHAEKLSTFVLITMLTTLTQPREI